MIDIDVVFNFNLGTSPCENGQVLIFIKEHNFIKRQLPPKHFALSLEQSDPNEVLYLVDSQLLLRFEVVHFWLLKPNFLWDNEFVHLVVLFINNWLLLGY